VRTPSSVPIGAILAQKYRVDAILGTGGMGIVLAATHRHLRQRVAIKLLHRETATRRGAVERFLREARVAMSLRGEHVVRIFDVGTLDDGSPFIAMECLEGSDFGALLDKAARLEPTVAVDYILQVSEAIAEAHALGIVHRDLKPANLFLTKRVDGTPCVKVLDFGVSKIAASASAESDLDDTDESSALSGPPLPMPSPVLSAAGEGITRSGVVIGSPRYMAPEQIRSPADVDARADVWALGVILFELLTGAPPFDGDTLEEVRASVTSAPVPRMSNVPLPLQAVIRRCMAKEPDGRYVSIHELAEALASSASGDGALVAARIGRIVGGGTSTAHATNVRRLLRRPNGPAALGALTLLALAVGAVGWGAAAGLRRPPVLVTSSVSATPSSTVERSPSPVATASQVVPYAEQPPAARAVAALPPPPSSTPASSPARARTGASRPVTPTTTASTTPSEDTRLPSPVPDPLRLDAGFLFRDRK
jgi:serine/threonine-protein kinase